MSTPSATRARRSVRPSGDDRQRAIVDTLERLLQDRPFGDIAIDDLATGADISRPTFYFYFAGKQDVLLELVDRLVAQVDERLAALPPLGDDAATWWRSAIGVFVDVFSAHRAATIAIADSAGTSEVRRVWMERSSRWTRQTAVTIAAEQARGAARASIDAPATSAALNAMNERVLAMTIAGLPHALPQDRVLDALIDVWLTTIYGTDG